MPLTYISLPHSYFYKWVDPTWFVPFCSDKRAWSEQANCRVGAERRPTIDDSAFETVLTRPTGPGPPADIAPIYIRGRTRICNSSHCTTLTTAADKSRFLYTSLYHRRVFSSRHFQR